MKNIFISILLGVMLLVSCDTERENLTTNEWQKDLQELYEMTNNMSNTKSETGDTILSDEDIALLNQFIDAIYAENNVAEIVAQSGYYGEGVLNVEISDMYDVLTAIEQYGTPEFYNMMIKASESKLSFSDVLTSTTLLPNEQVGLIIGTLIDDDLDDDDSNNSPESCAWQYEIDLSYCDETYKSAINWAYTVRVFSKSIGEAKMAEAKAFLKACQDASLSRLETCMKQ